MRKWTVGVVATVAVTLGGGTAHAAAPAQPVTVTNTPLPVEVVDTAPVEITNTSVPVSVTDTVLVEVTNAALPVEVLDTVPVELAPVEPVLARVSGTIAPGPAGASFPLYAVPPGMRLVVEHASAEAGVLAGSTAGFRLHVVGLRAHTLLASNQGDNNGTDIFAASQPVRFVAGPGQGVELIVFRSASAQDETNQVAGSISGYLVPDVP